MHRLVAHMLSIDSTYRPPRSLSTPNERFFHNTAGRIPSVLFSFFGVDGFIIFSHFSRRLDDLFSGSLREAIKKWNAHANNEPLIFGHGEWAQRHEKNEEILRRLTREAGGDFDQPDRGEPEIQRRQTPEYAQTEAQRQWELALKQGTMAPTIQRETERKHPGITKLGEAIEAEAQRRTEQRRDELAAQREARAEQRRQVQDRQRRANLGR